MTEPETVTERVAVIVHRLTLGQTMTITEVCQVANIKRAGAYALMARVSRVTPLVLDAGNWSLLSTRRGQ